MTTKSEVANTLLAAWLAENHPELFSALAARAGAASAPGLHGFTDVLSSIGSTIGSVASKVASGLSTTVQTVGTFLQSDAGKTTLATLAAAQLQSAQNKALQTQVQRANAGLTPAPITSTFDATTGSFVPALSTPGGAYPLSAQTLASLQPSFLDRYGLWLAAGGAALVLATMVLRQRG